MQIVKLLSKFMQQNRLLKGEKNKNSSSDLDKNRELDKDKHSLILDIKQIFEFDNNVFKFNEQPVEIYISKEIGVFRPDFLVKYRRDILPAKQYKPFLCHIVSRKFLWVNWKYLRPQLFEASKYASRKGWRFKILTEKEIRTPYLENVKFLSAYKHLNNIDQSDFCLLMDTIEKIRISSPMELIIAAARDTNKQAELLYTLWYMIANGFIYCDLNRDLTMRSEIW